MGSSNMRFASLFILFHIIVLGNFSIQVIPSIVYMEMMHRGHLTMLAYVSMTNIYTSASMREDAAMLNYMKVENIAGKVPI